MKKTKKQLATEYGESKNEKFTIGAIQTAGHYTKGYEQLESSLAEYISNRQMSLKYEYVDGSDHRNDELNRLKKHLGL